MRIQRQLKVVRVAGGMEKPSIWLSMTCPCSMNRGKNPSAAVLKIMPASRTGNILAKIFNSSTAQSFHGLGILLDVSSEAVIVAARSKNLNMKTVNLLENRECIKIVNL